MDVLNNMFSIHSAVLYMEDWECHKTLITNNNVYKYLTAHLSIALHA